MIYNVQETESSIINDGNCGLWAGSVLGEIPNKSTHLHAYPSVTGELVCMEVIPMTL